MADPFSSAVQGFQAGASVAQQYQMQQLREQQMQMEQYNTLGKIMEQYTINPKVGGVLLNDFGTRMGLPQDKIKELHQQFGALNEEQNQTIRNIFAQAGSKGDIPLSFVLKNVKPVEMFDFANKWAGAQAKEQMAKIESGVASMTGQGQAAPSGQAGVATPPPAATPVSSPGAAAPGPGAVPADLPPRPSGGAAPGPSADILPKEGVSIRTPTGQTVNVTSDLMSAPTMQNIVKARQWNAAADRLETAAGQQTGAVAETYMKRAEELRQHAKGLEGNAYVILPPKESVKFGLKTGAVVRYNVLNNDMQVVQPGEDTKQIVPFNDPVYQRLKPGAIVTRNVNTGDIEVKYAGEDTFKPLSKEKASELGIDPTRLAQISSSGKISTEKVAEDQFLPVSTGMRQVLAAQGIQLNPSQEYQINKNNNKLETLGSENKQYIDLTPTQLKALGVSPRQGVVAQREVGSGELHLKNTGMTAEAEASRQAAVSDQKELDQLRQQSGQASEALRMSQVTDKLLQPGATGALAPAELKVRQFADALGFKADPDKIKRGETLEAQFSKTFLTRGRMLPGSLSDREGNRIQQAGPTMLRTVEGNKLIKDIADWSSQVTVQESNMAEKWHQDFGGLSNPDPQTGKNFYQTRNSMNTTLPPELEQRLTKVEADAPDPKAIKGWNYPISEANEAQARRLFKMRDKLTPQQKLNLADRYEQLGITE